MCSGIKHLKHRRHVFEESVFGKDILSVQNITECYNPHSSTMKKSVENQVHFSLMIRTYYQFVRLSEMLVLTQKMYRKTKNAERVINSH